MDFPYHKVAESDVIVALEKHKGNVSAAAEGREMSILDHHALGDEDTYIVVSKAKGSDEATIHVHGSLGEVLDLLALTADAIDEQEPPVRH